MTVRSLFLLPLLCLGLPASAQVINVCTNPAAQSVLTGAYDPVAYHAATVINAPATISAGINAGVSPDSLHAILDVLRTFGTRNSASDTASVNRGIGAARRWVYQNFAQISAQNDNRLLPSYLQFDTSICGIPQHRNIFAVLPGYDTSDKSIVIIEGHIDSRDSDVCDTSRVAPGIEDNGSGTALVIELARVMSHYSYNHTIVFLVTIGEEQGLYGGYAFARYAAAQGIKIRSVFNNDIVGGIICGHTSSSPSCPGYENIDSTHVRLFSFGGFNSQHKGLSRFIKLEYKEMLQPLVSVPMGINIMTPEDRGGRGGDHRPFRELGFAAIRVTAQNEDGDADVTAPGYSDRQHTSSDSIGVDINNDGIIDSYFVDFNYLGRNAVINGNAAAMIATGPQTPDFTVSSFPGNLLVTITQHPEYLNYRVGIRTTTNDWDSVYTFTGTDTGTIALDSGGHYIVSVASVDSNGIESLFSREVMVTALPVNGIAPLSPASRSIELLQNKPNPADIATMISVSVTGNVAYHEAYISIRDMNGKEVSRKDVELHSGINEATFDHGYNMSGTYLYTLVVDGKVIDTKRMVFAN